MDLERLFQDPDDEFAENSGSIPPHDFALPASAEDRKLQMLLREQLGEPEQIEAEWRKPIDREWSEEELRLIEWFGKCDRERLLQVKELGPGESVINPERLVACLERDIEAGPNGPRARTGGLRSDLLRLQKML